MVAVDGVVFFQVLDAAKAAYEVSDLYLAIMQLTDDQPAHRDGRDGPRRDIVEARRDQCAAARHRRSGDRAVGREDHARRAEGYPPARRHRQRDDAPDEGRARKRASILESEGARQNDINRAEGQKQSQILEAEGRKEAAFRDAEARERSAQAEAAATKAVSDAIDGGSVQAINYFIAQKYVEAIGLFATSPNAKTILFPVEATQLMGTLGGIGQLAKEALGGDDKPLPRRCARDRSSDERANVRSRRSLAVADRRRRARHCRNGGAGRVSDLDRAGGVVDGLGDAAAAAARGDAVRAVHGGCVRCGVWGATLSRTQSHPVGRPHAERSRGAAGRRDRHRGSSRSMRCKAA